MATIIQGARFLQSIAHEVVRQHTTRYLGCAGSYIHSHSQSSRKLIEPKSSAQKLLHTSVGDNAASFHEIAEALSHHPGIIAVTGGGGLGIAAGLYRSPALWKLIARATSDQSVLLLPQKPSHVYQSRKSEVREIKNKFKLLRKRNGKGLSVAVYVTGRPGYGKTQLAREFGKEFYRSNRGWFFKNLVVGTLDATSSTTLLQSYITLAIDLGCTSELKTLEGLLGRKGELQGLGILSSAVKKELKKRPGWLIVVDNLSSDQETPKAYSSETLPVLSSSSLPYSTPGINRDSTSSTHTSGLASAFGITNHRATWKSFWPQPGDESWGTGYVLITTHDRRIVERSSPFTSELYLQDGMASDDALALLEKMSGGGGEGGMEVVNALDGAPLSVASAGYYINSERSRNPQYSFLDYIKGLESGIQAESEKMLGRQNISCPITMAMALSMAVQELISDDHLRKVFALLGACANTPVPLSLVARLLGVRPDINSAALEAVRSCALLVFPKSTSGSSRRVVPHLGKTYTDESIEVVSVYRGTREVFRDLLLNSMQGSCDEIQTPHVHSLKERNEVLHNIVDCLVQEYKDASVSDSVLSYPLRHMLIPHMESLLKIGTSINGYSTGVQREMDLCYSLGKGYLLAGKSNRAHEALERALHLCETNDGKGTVKAADIASKLGSCYRHLGRRAESEFVLKEALDIYEHHCGGTSLEVADTLTNLSTTYKHSGLYHKSKECLERALDSYDKCYQHYHPSVAIALTNLGAVMRSLGDSEKSKEKFEKALAMEEHLYEPNHPSIAVTLSQLSVAYYDLGQPRKSIELLERALEINKMVHGPSHISVAITMSNMSTAYRHLGEVTKSKELAEEALKMTEHLHGPAHPAFQRCMLCATMKSWEEPVDEATKHFAAFIMTLGYGTLPGVAISLGILGTTYCDLGELSKAEQLLQKSVDINRRVNGPEHIGMGVAQTLLGRVERLGGKLQSARKTLESALEIKEAVHGSDHPGVGVTLNSLGKVYHELGLLTKSLRVLQRSQSITENYFDPDHPQLAFGEADLAKVMRDSGSVEEAASIMSICISKYLKSVDRAKYTEVHPKYASMLAISGLMQRDLGDLYKARTSLNKALLIQEKIHSQQNLMKAETTCSLATVYHQLGDRQRAIGHLDSAMGIMKDICYTHPITATLSCALARVLMDTGDLHSARSSLEEAIKIRAACCGRLHPSNALYHTLLFEVHNQLGDVISAQEHSITAKEIYETAYEREKSLSDEAGLNLPILAYWQEQIDK